MNPLLAIFLLAVAVLAGCSVPPPAGTTKPKPKAAALPESLIPLPLAVVGTNHPSKCAMTIMWSEATTNSSSNHVTGFHIWWGTNSGTYGNVFNVNGFVTNATLPSVFIVGSNYYFAATAYNPNAESAYSQEIQWTAASVPWSILVTIGISNGPTIVTLTNPPGTASNRLRRQGSNVWWGVCGPVIFTNNPLVATIKRVAQ